MLRHSVLHTSLLLSLTTLVASCGREAASSNSLSSSSASSNVATSTAPPPNPLVASVDFHEPELLTRTALEFPGRAVDAAGVCTGTFSLPLRVTSVDASGAYELGRVQLEDEAYRDVKRRNVDEHADEIVIEEGDAFGHSRMTVRVPFAADVPACVSIESQGCTDSDAPPAWIDLQGVVEIDAEAPRARNGALTLRLVVSGRRLASPGSVFDGRLLARATVRLERWPAVDASEAPR